MLIDEIRQHANKITDAVVQYRRHLHSNPELSFHEYETSSFVKARLDEMNIPWQPMAGTGVVALIKGQKSSDSVVALRADMDALPIAEANDVSYKSTKEGVMHACGHDVHTSSLIGTATILQSIKGKFGGTVKLIFQPGEEKLPGGASMMIKEGVLKNPVPAAVIGQHVSPMIEAGKIGIHIGADIISGNGGQQHRCHSLLKWHAGFARFPLPSTPAPPFVAGAEQFLMPADLLDEFVKRSLDGRGCAGSFLLDGQLSRWQT